jgi:hypothetical protein
MTWRAMSDRPYRLIPRGVREAVRSAGHVGVHARVVRRLRAPASQGLAASPKRTSERCHSTQYPRQCSCLSPNITSVWCHSTQYPRQCSCLSPNITSERCHSTQYPRQYSACSPKRTSVWCNSTQHPRQYSAIPPNIHVSTVPFHPMSRQYGAITPNICPALHPGARYHLASVQGRTLVHFSAQLEPCSAPSFHATAQ